MTTVVCAVMLEGWEDINVCGEMVQTFYTPYEATPETLKACIEKLEEDLSFEQSEKLDTYLNVANDCIWVDLNVTKEEFERIKHLLN